MGGSLLTGGGFPLSFRTMNFFLTTMRLRCTLPFKVGDTVVYPPHGIARIGSIETQQVGEHALECYVLHIITSGATVIVPATNAAERAGMRCLMSTEEVEDVFSILKVSQKVSQRTWNRRFREFNDKLRSGSVLKAAEVYRD